MNPRSASSSRSHRVSDPEDHAMSSGRGPQLKPPSNWDPPGLSQPQASNEVQGENSSESVEAGNTDQPEVNIAFLGFFIDWHICADEMDTMEC